jgi:hypothetical protein
MLAVSALMLTGCDASTVSTKPDLGGLLSDADRRPCPVPVRLPKGDLKQAGVETYWKKDRLALVRCGAEKSNLVTKIDRTIKYIGK